MYVDGTEGPMAHKAADTDTPVEWGRRLRPAVIAIDGPAASGKSTIGQALAEFLGYLFFDTGVMYRAVTAVALERDLDVQNADVMTELAESIQIDIVPADGEHVDGRLSTVLVNGQDVTPHIRTAAVDGSVSPVSAHRGVRSALTRKQRRVGLQYGNGAGDKNGVVMVGRDIGTVVVPDAPVKIFLDASPEERARRRYKELTDKGIDVEFSDVLHGIVRRDEIDSGRDVAPLALAEDATVVDTTELTPEQVIAHILDLLRASARD